MLPGKQILEFSSQLKSQTFLTDWHHYKQSPGK